MLFSVYLQKCVTRRHSTNAKDFNYGIRCLENYIKVSVQVVLHLPS
jgi:hypothetical protein